MPDPISELLEALDRDGKPPLAWVVRWSQDGHDPVAAAWAQSRDPTAMMGLLHHRRSDDRWRRGLQSARAEVRRVQRPDITVEEISERAGSQMLWRTICDGAVYEVRLSLRRREAQSPYREDIIFRYRSSARGILRDDCLQTAQAAAIRLAVPTPPTLADLLAAHVAR